MSILNEKHGRNFNEYDFTRVYDKKGSPRKQPI